MRQNGISGQLLKPFQNYLNNRKHRVALNSFPADYSTIECPPMLCSWSPIIPHIHQ